MYTCRLWKNTGFDAVNIPDGVATFNSLPYTDFPALDILQARGLSEVTIRATDADVRDVDYMCLYSVNSGDDNRATYYAVTGYSMQARDSATLFIVEDYITSLGGVQNLALVGGIVKRMTVGGTETFGQYCVPDGLLGCAEPLVLHTKWMYDERTGGELTACETSVNLYSMGDPNAAPAEEFTDSVTGAAVTVPIAVALPQGTRTAYYIIESAYDTTQGDYVTILTQVDNPTGCVIYPLNLSDTALMSRLRKGIERLRSISADSAIIAQYSIPAKFADFTMDQTQSSVTYGAITRIDGDQSTAIPRAVDDSAGSTGNHFRYVYHSVENLRVLYGSNSRYGLLTCAGVSGEYLPEDIYSDRGNAPRLQCIADPRHGGAPYFRYENYLKNSEFWRDALRGCTWVDVPLRYTGQRGAADAQNAYNLAVMGENTSYTQSDGLWAQNFNFMYGDYMGGMSRADLLAIGGALGVAGGAFGQIMGQRYGDMTTPVADANAMAIGAGIGTGITGAARGGVAAVIAGETVAYKKYNDQQKHAHELAARTASRRQELYSMGVQTVTRAPEIKFMAGSEAVRDLHGNGCLAYRYTPSDRDIERLDKILTWFGYAVDMPVSEVLASGSGQTLFGNRQNFDYVEISGASVTASTGSKAEREGARDQLGIGVRVWHGQKPSNVATNPKVI